MFLTNGLANTSMINSFSDPLQPNNEVGAKLYFTVCSTELVFTNKSFIESLVDSVNVSPSIAKLSCALQEI